ncbi:MAG: metallophosphoesterase family protein [Clostridia bacterium]|nr:metallophosphoesterase family protein [Clostridia bacterium]
MKKFLAAILSIVMIMSVGVVSFANYNAPRLSEEEWEEYYMSLISENTLPTLNVGADETQVSLCWHAEKETAKPQVRISKNPDMSGAKVFNGEKTPAENDEQLVCRVTVKNLEENTSYYYQWNTGDAWSEVCSYETKSFGNHKALVAGDIQITEIYDGGDDRVQIKDGLTWNNLLSEALEKNPDISYFVTPGDNTSSGCTAAEWQTLLMPKALRSLPMAMAIGNHDKKGMMYNYYTNMPNEYYGKHFRGLDRDFWFRYGDVLYLFFDSTSGDAPDHIAMAKEAVKLNPDAKWRIGVVHHGIYGAGDAIGDLETELLLTTIFAPIFETYDLDLVITGHTHSQGRSHFMENGKVVANAEGGKTYTDPEGVVYLNSNSVTGTPVFDYEAEHLAYAYVENEVPTYSTLEFEGNTMKLETRRGDNSELLDSITIERTTDERNENSLANSLKRLLYKVVEFVGFVYTKIDTLIRMFG